MKKVWMATDCVLSPLGTTTEENFSSVQQGLSGIHQIKNERYNPSPFFASGIQDLVVESGQTRFESMCSHVIRHVLKGIALPSDRTILVLATTKGNISLLEEN